MFTPKIIGTFWWLPNCIGRLEKKYQEIQRVKVAQFKRSELFLLIVFGFSNFGWQGLMVQTSLKLMKVFFRNKRSCNRFTICEGYLGHISGLC
jgi:hypothetical protein